MNRYRFAWLTALIVLLLGGFGVRGDTNAALAQASSIEDMIKAVVRISGQRCQPVCREAGVGSGAIIHPSGVILTAYHALLDPEKSPPQFLDDYIIEMSEDVRRPAAPRYRAHIIAVQPELDFALLRIYKTVDGEQDFLPFALTGLPTLSLGSTKDLFLQDGLTIAGYPYLAGSSIKVASFPLTGFAPQQLSGVEIPDANLTIQGGLSEGYSGGPVLAERDGAYRIVGVVTGGLGLRAEIGALRSIDLLHDLQWLEPQARAYARRVQLELGQDASGEQELRISLDLDALDLAGRQARLIFYAYADDVLGLPMYAASGTNCTRAGQLALALNVAAQHFVDRIEATRLRLPVSASSIAATPLKFRALLWDNEVLWQENEWYRLQPLGEAQVTPVPSPSRTGPPAATTTATPTQTRTIKPLPTDTPPATPTPSPTWTLTPSPTIAHTATRRPTPTRTPTPIPPTPAATLGPGSTRVAAKDGMVMIYVPAGEFLMGSTNADTDAFDDEKPQHKVYLDAFWIDRTEVTNAMFARFVAETGHETDPEQLGQSWALNITATRWERTQGADWRHPDGPGSDIQGLEQFPVVQVGWNDAVAYCRWAGRRLPTEAEWEKAARGTDGRKYPWGNTGTTGSLLNFADRNLDMSAADTSVDDGYQFAAPVGVYLAGASPYGVLDMAGNVWEWVADWYDAKYYFNSPTRNPQGPDSGELRALRGGSWSCPQRYVRTAVRLRHDSNVDIGFRCASFP